MEPESSKQQRAEDLAPRQGGRRLWSVLFVVVAISLWAQWLGAGALAEIQSEDGSSMVLALQLLPLAAMAVALMWHHSAARLALVPVSFLPGLALLADAEWAALSSPWALSFAVATFALYLVVAASRPTDEPVQSFLRRSASADYFKDGQAHFFRRFVALRFAVMGFLFVLITYALFFDPSTQQALASLEGEKAAVTQHVFMVILLYFGWVIAVYMGAILPALNWEYRRRRSALPTAQRQLLAQPARLGRRVFFWLMSLLIVVFLTFWFLI